MRHRPLGTLRPATIAFLALAATTLVPAMALADGQEASAAEVMQSVFANRVRDGGFWRQDNQAFEEGADVPKYWMQVWRNGPGDEVVIVDAYAVKADDTCSALMHSVYSYDRDAGRIQLHGYGANGLSPDAVVSFDGTVTSTELSLQLPGGERRMRDREDQGAAEAVLVEVEVWDGKAWVPGKPATWRRSAEGLPCNKGALRAER